MHSISPLQKDLALAMAALAFLLAVFIPNSRRESQRVDGLENAMFVSSISVHSTPDLPSSSEALPKVSLILFSLASFWSLLLFLKALEVQENQILLKGFFLQKIHFIFVSTKAP